MFKSIVFVFATLSSFAVLAEGGAIGGGEVTFKKLLVCDAESMDPTFPSDIVKLAVAAETDYDGKILPQQPLKVMLSQRDETVVNYLQTRTLPAEFGAPSLTIYRWSDVLPGQRNAKLGKLEISETTGVLRTLKPRAGFEDLVLYNCEYTVDAQ